MLSLDILVDYVLEDLYYIMKIMVDSLNIFTVNVIGFTVWTEHQKAFDYLTIHDPLGLVKLSIFPDAFWYQFDEAQVSRISIKTALGIRFVRVSR